MLFTTLRRHLGVRRDILPPRARVATLRGTLALAFASAALLGVSPRAQAQTDELGNLAEHEKDGHGFGGSPKPITFTVMGDVPYDDAEVPVFQSILAEHNLYSKAEFAVHVGDIFHATQPCTEDRYELMADMLKTLAVPTFIIPGDNETGDCSDEIEAWSFWEKHLMALDDNYCGTPSVDRQPVRPENFAFIKSGVLFIGVNIIAGAQDIEMIDGEEWVEQQLMMKGSIVRSAVVFSQAGFASSSSRDLFYEPFKVHVANFEKPVLLAHGDGHTWQEDYAYKGVTNLTRIQIKRTTTPPVHVTVTDSEVQPFLFDQDPWPSGTPVFNQRPCADAGGNQIVAATQPAYLFGKTSDDGVPAGPPHTSVWTQIDGPGLVSFQNPSDPITSATFSSLGDYRLRLSVSDGVYTQTDDLDVVAADPSSMPFANDDSYNIDEDTVLNPAAPGVLWNDSHGSGEPLSASMLILPSHGKVTLSSDGSFTYTPDAHWFGVDTFVYQAADPGGGTGTAQVTITVNAVNDVPIAVDDVYLFEVGDSMSQPAPGVMANDLDPDGQILVATLVSGTTNGTLQFNTDGSFAWTPPLTFIGTDSLVYQITDGLSSDIATATLSVSPVLLTFSPTDDSYVRSNRASNNYGANEEMYAEMDPSQTRISYLKFDVSGVESDVLGATLRLYVAPDGGGPLGGTVHQVSNNYASSATPWNEGGLIWSNAPPIVSPALDGLGAVNEKTWVEWDVTPAVTGDGTVSLAIQNPDPNRVDYNTKESINVPMLIVETDLPNDPPVANPDFYTMAEDVSLTLFAPGVLANDTDDPRDVLSTTLLTSPANGIAILNANGAFAYVPDDDFNGVDIFEYRLVDQRGGTDSTIVTITVNPVNDAPVAQNDSYSTNEDTNLVVPAPGVLGNDIDVDGDPLSVVVLAAPSKGVLTLNADGSFTYAPNTNSNGADAFTYTVADGNGTTDTGTVSLTVNPVNDAPVAQDDSHSTNEDVQLTVSTPGILANDSDVDGDALQAALTTPASNGNVTVNADGSFTYMPNAHFNGSDSFVYTVDDGNGGTDTGNISLTVNSINDAPVAGNDTYSVDEDSVLTVAAPGVLANDGDVDGDPLTTAIASGPASGSLTLGSNGSFTYTPNGNFNGSDSFTYTVSDGVGGSHTGSVSLTVNSINDAPVPTSDAYSVPEDGTLVVSAPGVLGNDNDVDGDALQATLLGAAAHGLVTVNANGSFTYAPNANYNGADAFTYTVADGNGGSATGTVGITVNAVNDAPVAVDDNASTNEDMALNVGAPGVLGNDTDVDANPLTAALLIGPANGNVTLNANGSFTYTPDANYNGTDSFTYQAHDGQGGTNSAVMSITVNPVNDAPVGVGESYSTDEDVTLNVSAPGILSNDTDVDGDALSAVVLAAPANGNLSLAPNGSFTYVPAADFNGTDSFSYTLSDGQGGSDTALVSLTVNPTNDAPVAGADAYSVDEDLALSVPAPGLLSNDTDVEGNPLSASLASPPGNGSAVVDADGSFSYTPNADFNGNDSFTYTLSDGNGGSDAATVTITVNSVNDAPVAQADAYSTDEDVILTVSVPGVLDNDSDVDGDVLSTSVVSGPTNGTLALNANGSFTFTPDSNWSGLDSFVYAASDGNGGTANTTVTLTVVATNDAPVASGDSGSVNEDAVLVVSAPGVLGNDSDVDGDALSAAVASGPSDGNLTLNADGSYTYTPNANFNGSDSFTYTASDGNGGSDTATVTITVNAINDIPTVAGDSYSVDEDSTLAVSTPGVLSNDGDVDGDALTAAVDLGPANGALTLNADGSFTYTPTGGYSGSDSFTYTASDGNGGSAGATVSITVVPGSASVALERLSLPRTEPEHDIEGMDDDSSGFSAEDRDTPRAAHPDVSLRDKTANIVPTVADDTYEVWGDEGLRVAAPGLVGNDTDPEGTALSVELETDVQNGVLTLGGDGSFTYRPNAGFSGPDSFTYIVSDGVHKSLAGRVDLSVQSGRGVRLLSMRPNPFNSRTVVQYELYEPGAVELIVYDARGRRVRSLVRGPQSPGRHDVRWEARNDRGIEVESGVYFIRLRLGDEVFTRRLILLK